MEVRFSKWEGTGNDFILIDDRTATFPVDDVGLIKHLCDRHLGVGSDGLILIQGGGAEVDFHMEFFNPDGTQSFCGNGSRCAFAFWRSLVNDDPVRGAVERIAIFHAIDGEHRAEVMGANEVGVSMWPPKGIERISDSIDFMNTGSPHLLVWVSDPEAIDIIPAAHVHRYGERFKEHGVNVNFVAWNATERFLQMRTFERGVEAETLSCGTGVTAAALSGYHRGLFEGDSVEVRTRGGRLRVAVDRASEGLLPGSVTLVGPATPVFSGTLNWK